MILLDTCVVLWLSSSAAQISRPAAAALRAQSGNLFVSSISAFEIGQKANLGKLTLPQSISTWFPAVLAQHGLHELPVTGAIAAQATLLPTLHRDPFDRLFVATAQAHALILVTPDLRMRRSRRKEALTSFSSLVAARAA